MAKFWIKTIIISIALAFLFGLLIFLDRGFDIYFFNRLFASMAFIMIGISLISASLVYFTNKFHILLSYRMYFGLMGFFFAILHASSSLAFYFLFNSDKIFYEFDKMWPIIGGLSIPNTVAYTLGETALIMFLFMAIITMKRFVVKLGGVLWRELLRVVGYIAFSFVLLHFFIKDFHIWTNIDEWASKSNFIPTNLILFLFGIVIIILRVALQRELNKKKKVQTT